MNFDEESARENGAELVRSACEELGADDEMTALVLASHRHAPEALDALVAEGGDLLGYVRLNLARWEAIFEED
jgi:hypothetical protein